ncbi:hypothetical protein DWB79_08260 [Treponema medium]|uniref:Uncharacterized protein n=2 Tax=Treponema medium TaxID=58231 RepID=A0AA87NSE9_TREMD|nr:hypothetical protein [Treponema medium]EPF28422.1 hypothetical protein HMPREF9195_01631 [Treponema medium ATCC 700293]QSH97738.1 hypothetical protein DWB79_08260 [Treponema medium]
MSNRRGHRKENRYTENTAVNNKPYLNSQHEEPVEVFTCARCGKPIKDLSAALADKTDGNPVHFDCVLNFLKQNETLQENEAISYIGQGRFAVIKYASMVTMKEFTIVRIIEWEDKNQRAEWRGTIADRFSLID